MKRQIPCARVFPFSPFSRAFPLSPFAWALPLLPLLLLVAPGIARPNPIGTEESVTPRAFVPLTEVLDEDSPVFPLGKAAQPNLTLRSSENPEMSVSLGIRFQGIASLTEPEGDAPPVFDAFARRVRFEIAAQLSKHSSFVMDIRNDNANRQDRGEGGFNVGNAYFVSRSLLGYEFLNFKAYRGKIDVSRTEPTKSAWLVYYDRPAVADFAANFVSHNRRAANVQLFGNWDGKLAYSFAIGDGVHAASFEDARGNDLSAQSIDRQNPMVGGKLILSPIEGWEERERTETYFGQGQHFEVGAAYFRTGNIHFNQGVSSFSVSHGLLNLEASTHYRRFFVQAEYFRFDEVIEDLNAATPHLGTSAGWYALTEICFPELSYLAPFFRFERWDRFQQVEGYLHLSRVAGINWYLRGNTARIGLAAQSDTFGSQLGSSEIAYKLTSQIHF